MVTNSCRRARWRYLNRGAARTIAKALWTDLRNWNRANPGDQRLWWTEETANESATFKAEKVTELMAELS